MAGGVRLARFSFLLGIRHQLAGLVS